MTELESTYTVLQALLPVAGGAEDQKRLLFAKDLALRAADGAGIHDAMR
jgi:hypothetical protein